MKILTQSLLRAIATFGIVAGLTALSYILFNGGSSSSDDPYIFGVAVGIVVGIALFISLLCEHLLGKRKGSWIYAGLYGVMLIYTWYVVKNSELHGPGLALLIFGAALIFAMVEFFLLRSIHLRYYASVGFVLGVITLTLLFKAQL